MLPQVLLLLLERVPFFARFNTSAGLNHEIQPPLSIGQVFYVVGVLCRLFQAALMLLVGSPPSVLSIGGCWTSSWNRIPLSSM
jgi:hypothetical protein